MLSQHYTQVLATNKEKADELHSQLTSIKAKSRETGNQQAITQAVTNARANIKQGNVTLAKELLDRNQRKRQPTEPLEEPLPTKSPRLDGIEGLLRNLLEQNKVNTKYIPNIHELTKQTTPPTDQRIQQAWQQGTRQGKRPQPRKRPPLNIRKLNKQQAIAHHKHMYHVIYAQKQYQ